jgi:CubicO group peptidase (beta-lactamase class C family)
MRIEMLKLSMLLLVLITLSGTAVAQRTQQATQITGVKRFPRGISEAKLKTHVIAPEYTKDVEIEEVDPARETFYPAPRINKTLKTKPMLNVVAFSTAMHAALKDNVAGYIMQVRQNGNVIYDNVWKWAQTPSDLSKGWNENTRMHVASVSKFLTAVGLVKLLDSKGISYDDKIINYLPTYWTKGSNINQISFRNLFTHTSGFTFKGTATDFQTMKSKVAAGVSNIGGDSAYENMNYGLMRILIAVINGDIDKDTIFSSQTIVNDQAWDGLTINYYKDYMQDNVFVPAGINDAGFVPLPAATGGALAYPFPELNAKGWNSGDLSTVSGAAGWRLSIKELLDVLNHVRRKNTIIGSQKAQYMLDHFFGIDQAFDTPAGKIYNKNGGWKRSGKREQCVIYFFPNQIEIAVFVNSFIGTEDYSLRGIVKDAYMNSLE